MNVTLPEKESIKKRTLIVYISILVFCIIAIIIAFYVQFYARIDFTKLFDNTIQAGDIGNKTEEEVQIIKSEFDELFTNDFKDDGEHNNKKKDKRKDLIYTNLEKKDTKQNSYDLDVHIPYINIDNKIIDEYNKEIEEFEKKTKEITESKNKNIIYTVEYVVDIEQDILSLMIRSSLKEGSSAQRLIIQTYNYDLRNNKEISLEEVLDIYRLNKNQVQNQIKSEIEIEQKKVDDLKKLGYTMYQRDIKSKDYEINNTKQFFLTDNKLYIIYPYGNKTYTNEKDIIVL